MDISNFICFRVPSPFFYTKERIHWLHLLKLIASYDLNYMHSFPLWRCRNGEKKMCGFCCVIMVKKILQRKLSWCFPLNFVCMDIQFCVEFFVVVVYSGLYFSCEREEFSWHELMENKLKGHHLSQEVALTTRRWIWPHAKKQRNKNHDNPVS